MIDQNRRPYAYKALREAIGLSQRAVERELGWFEKHRGRLSLIERGLIPSQEEHEQLVTFYISRAPQAIVADSDRG